MYMAYFHHKNNEKLDTLQMTNNRTKQTMEYQHRQLYSR